MRANSVISPHMFDRPHQPPDSNRSKQQASPTNPADGLTVPSQSKEDAPPSLCDQESERSVSTNWSDLADSGSPDLVEIDSQLWKRAETSAGEEYYFNIDTKEARWTLPEEYLAIDVQTGVKYAPLVAPSCSKCSPGQARTDEVPGRMTWYKVDDGRNPPYFFNSLSGHTSWTLPVPADAATDDQRKSESTEGTYDEPPSPPPQCREKERMMEKTDHTKSKQDQQQQQPPAQEQEVKDEEEEEEKEKEVQQREQLDSRQVRLEAATSTGDQQELQQECERPHETADSEPE